jgi:hypothetical protein
MRKGQRRREKGEIGAEKRRRCETEETIGRRRAE